MSTDRTSVPRTPRLLAPFEGFRGLAALSVCLYHLHHVPGLSTLTARLPGFFGSGWVFVDVFFVLSGWVIAHVYADRIAEGSATLRAFFAARVARLWPLHMVVLLVWFAMAPVLFGAVGAGAYAGCLPQLATLSFTWGPLACAAPVPPAWSISAEMVAYLAFPLLVAAGLLRSMRGALVLIAVGVGGYLAMQTLWGGFHVYDGRAPLRALSGFFIGAGLWRCLRDAPLADRTATRVQWIAAAGLIGGIALNLPPFFLLGASVLLIVGVAAGHGPLARLLSTRPLLTLGRLSFGLYLWHWFAIMALARLGDAATLPLALIAVLVVCVVADLSYRAVEMPARHALRRGLSGSGAPKRAMVE
jgi:peptidoglycan/LPS O-acetylase OafA/YrhL